MKMLFSVLMVLMLVFQPSLLRAEDAKPSAPAKSAAADAKAGLGKLDDAGDELANEDATGDEEDFDLEDWGDEKEDAAADAVASTKDSVKETAQAPAAATN